MLETDTPLGSFLEFLFLYFVIGLIFSLLLFVYNYQKKIKTRMTDVLLTFLFWPYFFLRNSSLTREEKENEEYLLLTKMKEECSDCS